MKEKYKKRYVEKVLDLKKKLSEVKEKDDKLIRVLRMTEQYNDMNLVGLANLHKVFTFILWFALGTKYWNKKNSKNNQ